METMDTSLSKRWNDTRVKPSQASNDAALWRCGDTEESHKQAVIQGH